MIFLIWFITNAKMKLILCNKNDHCHLIHNFLSFNGDTCQDIIIVNP